MRLIITSDWELTTARLPVARKILEDLAHKMSSGDRLIFTGDMFREFNASTVAFASDIVSLMGHKPMLLIGNHDREIGADRLSALFANDMHTFDVPRVFYPSTLPPLAFLPAPDRAAFGAFRGAEGRKSRDGALSEALEAALISLETQIGPENLGRAIMFFHGAVSSDELAPGQIAEGITWSIPASRLQRWGLAIGGHIHRPSKIGENIYSVGGIANWTFSDRAERFRALVVETDTLEVAEIPLRRVLVPIEMELEETAILANPLIEIVTHYLHGHGVDMATDTVALKIKARLPQHEMAIVPSAEELQEQINDVFERRLIDSCIITREVTGLHKARLTTEQSAREMSLEDMLELYVETSGNGNGPVASPETAAAAKERIARVAEYYRVGTGNFGFRPLRIELSNFRQWAAAELDFTTLEGAVALTGRNATGKSNLLEAMLVALYKRSPSSSSSIEDELRLGETRGHIILAFEARGERYILRRAFERGRGGVTCKSELLRDIVPPEPVCEAANDIDKRIIELIGSYEFTLSSIFRAQRDLDRLIEATPTQWHKLMLEALALERFEPLRKAAANHAENAALRARENQVLIEDHESRLEILRRERGEIDQVEMGRQIETLNANLARAEAAKTQLDETRQKLIAERAEIRAKLNARTELENRLRDAKRAFSAIVIAPLGDRPEPIELPEGMTDGRRARLELDIQHADEKLRDWRKQHATEQANIQTCESAIRNLAAAKNETLKRFDEWDKARAALPEAPCDRINTFDPADRSPNMPEPFRDGCHYYQQAARPETGLRLMAEVKSYQQKLEGKERELVTAQTEIDSLAISIADLDGRRIKDAETLANMLAEIDQARQARNAIEAYDLKAKAQEQLVGQQVRLGQEIAVLEKQIVVQPEIETALSGILREIERIENRIGAQDGIIKAAHSAIREAQRTLEAHEQLGKRIVELEAEIAAKKAAAAEHAADQAAWGLIAEAFHHTGIPYLLMERVIGSFERIANELLESTGLTVQIETVTPTRKGEARDRLSVKFTDARGQHWLSQASGAQSAMLGMALAAALAIVGSQFWGAVPEIYVQDEGWDRFHADAHETARELIAAIARRFTRFIYITHVVPLAESADVHLRVEAEGGVSRLVA